MSEPMTPEREAMLTWNCRFHPTDWWHEIGCPHREWPKEQLQSALESNKREQPKIYAGWVADEQKRTKELRAALAESERVRKEQADEIASLKQWKDSINGVVQCLIADDPSLDHEWGGDRSGWGFVFEWIKWVVAQRDSLREQLVAAQKQIPGCPEGMRVKRLIDVETISGITDALAILEPLSPDKAEPPAESAKPAGNCVCGHPPHLAFQCNGIVLWDRPGGPPGNGRCNCAFGGRSTP